MTKDTGIVMIHGRAYETVAFRVQKFRAEHKDDNSIETKIISIDENVVVVKAVIRNKDGRVIATGHAEEVRAASSINRTSALEVAETSAIGRALAAYGLAGAEFASADEVAGAIGQQATLPQSNSKPWSSKGDKPVLTGMASDKQKETIAKNLASQGVSLEEMPGYLMETYGVETPLSKEAASFVIEDLFEQAGYVRSDDRQKIKAAAQ